MHKEIEYIISKSPVEYEIAADFMEKRASLIKNGAASELIWFLEHPHVYTAGSSAEDNELLNEGQVPVYKTPRGGRYTYHGPGQRIIYLMLDLDRFERDIRSFIKNLEEVLIKSFISFDIDVYPHRERIGLWVKNRGHEEKIGAIGLKIKKWISLHGVAINIDPDLSYFNGIIPCGLPDYGVTSVRKINDLVTMDKFDREFIKNFQSKVGDLKQLEYLDYT
tara:strand:+ start:19 stop:681 length:663 start_codon:yes stop_codon:yes gene_type:complete